MRLSRRTRCPSTNSFILIVALVILFVLLIRRHSTKIKNGEDKFTETQGHSSYLDNIKFLESMKKMFSVSGQEDTTLPKIPRTKMKHEDLYRVTVSNEKEVTSDGVGVGEKPYVVQYMAASNAEMLPHYDVQFSNLTLDHVTMKSELGSNVSGHLGHGHRNFSNIEQDLISRTNKVEKQCQRLSVFGTIDNEVRAIMTNRERRIAYCFIPKCGCTFWKRVIRFLNRDYKGRNLSSPFQIRRLETHSLVYSKPDTFLPFRVFLQLRKLYSSFMFVREPYARLWSAYVDKFYLPDFWGNFEKQIKANRHPSYARRCVNDVTFQEFVSLSLDIQEPHWDPMYHMCDPCTYKPDLIGRVESFATDSRYILEKANLSWIMDGYDHATHVQEELVTLINYNFELIAVKPYISRCISKVGMFRRLWKTFQINGYLPADAFPSRLDKTTTTADFIRIVLDTYRRRPNTPEVWRKQRKEFMIAAYKTISTATLGDLRLKYARDFLLFNYDPRPVEIFGNRH